MSPFAPDNLSVEILPHRDRFGLISYRTLDDITWSIESPSGTFRVTIPAGFETNFASIPRWLHWWLPPNGEYRRAAVLHDYLYSLVKRGEMSRALADAFFREAMREDGVSWITRTLIYAAVRMFGGLHNRR